VYPEVEELSPDWGRLLATAEAGWIACWSRGKTGRMPERRQGGLHARAEAEGLHARARRATGVQVVLLHASAEAG
jgi:hypothetical protein